MRVAARRGSIVENATLAGCSILVIEEQPFVARCLQILLGGAGAEVHCTTCAGEALDVIDRRRFSAALLDCSQSAKGRRRVVQRLVRLGLPFVFCKEIDQDETWPGVPVLIKPVIGVQLVDVLYRLIEARKEKIASSISSSTRRSQPAAR
jgi:CheY-like chemotaxis protein